MRNPLLLLVKLGLEAELFAKEVREETLTGVSAQGSYEQSADSGPNLVSLPKIDRSGQSLRE
jgi:hypothetical protein